MHIQAGRLPPPRTMQHYSATGGGGYTSLYGVWHSPGSEGNEDAVPPLPQLDHMSDGGVMLHWYGVPHERGECGV